MVKIKIVLIIIMLVCSYSCVWINAKELKIFNEIEEVEDEKTPLSKPEIMENWAISNIILSIIIYILGIQVLFENDSYRNKQLLLLKIVTSLIMIITVMILFLHIEFSNHFVIIDSWTISFIILLILQLFILMVSYSNKQYLNKY